MLAKAYFFGVGLVVDIDFTPFNLLDIAYPIVKIKNKATQRMSCFDMRRDLLSSNRSLNLVLEMLLVSRIQHRRGENIATHCPNEEYRR